MSGFILVQYSIEGFVGYTNYKHILLFDIYSILIIVSFATLDLSALLDGSS